MRKTISATITAFIIMVVAILQSKADFKSTLIVLFLVYSGMILIFRMIITDKNERGIERIINARKKLDKAIIKKNRARANRIWIEKNSHIHLLNYPYYKLKRCLNWIITYILNWWESIKDSSKSMKDLKR